MFMMASQQLQKGDGQAYEVLKDNFELIASEPVQDDEEELNTQ
jgi:hypothetical protein